MAMAEKQSLHRMELEKIVILGDSKRSWYGLVFGFAVVLAICVSRVIVAMYRSPTAGAAIITTTIASLAGVFVLGQSTRRSERARKAEVMTGKPKD